MAYFRCGTTKDTGINELEPFKYVSFSVGGYKNEAQGILQSHPENVKKVFPNHYKKMSADDFELWAHLGASIYSNKQEYSSGYTQIGNISGKQYDAATGTLTVSNVEIRKTASGINTGHIFQGCLAKWLGTIGGKEG